jgi:hypothetical protein
MTYLFATIFFVLGIFIGIGIAVKIFSTMANQGNLVFKADLKHWEGEPEAFESIVRQVVKE